MLRARDAARVEEISSANEAMAAAKDATMAAHRSELAAWTAATAAMRRAMDAEHELERLRSAVRWRAERAQAAAEAAAVARPQTPPNLFR